MASRKWGGKSPYPIRHDACASLKLNDGSRCTVQDQSISSKQSLGEGRRETDPRKAASVRTSHNQTSVLIVAKWCPRRSATISRHCRESIPTDGCAHRNQVRLGRWMLLTDPSGRTHATLIQLWCCYGGGSVICHRECCYGGGRLAISSAVASQAALRGKQRTQRGTPNHSAGTLQSASAEAPSVVLI
jgi:hypothetical protein